MKQEKLLYRLDRILSNNGYCTRGGAREFLRIHTVTADGNPAQEPSAKFSPAAILIDDQPIEFPFGMLIAVNKPADYICSHESSEGPLIYDLLPEQWMARNPQPSTIGRLDKDATGLIIITDITHLMHDLTSPRHHIEKTYEVTVNCPLPADIESVFSSGTLMLKGEDDPCLPATLLRTGETTATVILSEGRFHQVKRMFASCGCIVLKLHRTKFGPYSLDNLAEGEWRAVDLQQH